MNYLIKIKDWCKQYSRHILYGYLILNTLGIIIYCICSLSSDDSKKSYQLKISETEKVIVKEKEDIKKINDTIKKIPLPSIDDGEDLTDEEMANRFTDRGIY